MNVSRASNTRARNVKSDGKSRRSNKRRFRRQPVTVGRRVGTRVDNYMNFGRQAASDLNALRRFINTEVHYLDTSATGTNITNGTVFALLNGMATGDTSTTRTGQSIKMDRLDLRFSLNGNVTAVQMLVRVFVVLDKQSNGAIFADTDVLQATNVIAPYNVGNQNRFVIVYDDTFALSTGGPLNIVQTVRLPTNQHVDYTTAGGATIANILTNSLYLLFLGDQAVNFPTINYYARLWFIDN